ncbi:ribonuclease D [Isoalcanivorax pacificus W11-5]|uniref:Ribonuclease D n=1 Tax=Isoalcanivorax pacificus W11-5 TaxID=391936 RepID=A0A0B4XQR6_9GAMM|nr:ribonuclease D [Isoalcanivorax pacificus]AJD48577.1 ribonuclease D [Isoalcanivorax pacificus W11-5]
MTYRWIDRVDDLQDAMAGLSAQQPLYLDTEFMRERTFWPQLALVQVNTGDAIWLIDAPALADPTTLAPLCAGHPLVMHACSEDIEALNVFTGAAPVAIEDTQIAAALCGHDLQCSYQRLVRELTGTELPKDATRTDWLKRPLSPQQLAYARDDVVWLPELAERLREQLAGLGRLVWWQEECQRLLDSVQAQVPAEDAWRQVKGAGHLQGVALARLQQLAAWRDRMARERDLPRGFIIRDPALLALAQQPPRQAEGLHDQGVHPSVIRRDGETLLVLLREAEQMTPPAPLPEPPDAAQRDRVKQLRTHVGKIAAQLGVEPEVLVRRRWLEALVREPEQIPAPMQGWRRTLVAEPLQEILLND